MPQPSNQGVELVSCKDLERILEITDGLGLHRDWVVVPIDAIPEGRETLQPDGKIILHAPVRARFEGWLQGLSSRLLDLGMGAVPRQSENDPKVSLTGPCQIQARGTRNYLGSLGILH